MPARHLVFLIEEPSMETFLDGLLPTILPDGCTFECRIFPYKASPSAKLQPRLRAYARWLPQDWRLVLLVDRDQEDCHCLKQQLEDVVRSAGFQLPSAARGGPWRVVIRIAIEELEAWYFGNWDAVRAAYPRVPETVPQRAKYRDPDAVSGGTWEAFERVLQRAGYFSTGLRKIEAARAIAPHLDPRKNRSRSFVRFHDAVEQATS